MTLSALQHWPYCPRHCGLIHLEQAFDENLHTQRGHAVHAQVDTPGVEQRKGVRIDRALPLWGAVLGLIGKADGQLAPNNVTRSPNPTGSTAWQRACSRRSAVTSAASTRAASDR